MTKCSEMGWRKMDRKLVIGLALSSLLLVGCSNKSGQLKDTAILFVTYATFTDYYKNGDWDDVHYSYKNGELTIKIIENRPLGEPNTLLATYTYVGDFDWTITDRY